MVRTSQLCICMVVLVCAALGGAEAAEVSVAAGVDVWSELEFSDGDIGVDVDTDVGFSLGLEIVQPVSSIVQLGGGIDYLVPREIEDLDSDVSFLAGFAVVRVAAFGEASRFSLLARAGYATWELDTDAAGDFDEEGGLYLALGVGFDISEHLGIEAIGMRLSGNLEIEEPGESFTDDVDYDVLSLRVRYRF